MTTAIYLAGSLFGILLILLVARYVSGSRTRHSSQLKGSIVKGYEDEYEDPMDAVAGLTGHPITWVIVFFAMIAAAVGTVVIWLSEDLGLTETGPTLAVLVFGTIIAGHLVYGVYLAARNRGHSNALSIAESLLVLGLIAIAAVAAVLMT